MTAAPTPTWEEAIGRAVIDYRIKCDMALSERDDGFYTQAEYQEALVKQMERTKAAINKAVLELVIGEDEPEYHDPGCNQYKGYGYCFCAGKPAMARNLARAEQRQRLAKLLKESV